MRVDRMRETATIYLATRSINKKTSMGGQHTNLSALTNGKQYNLFVLLMNKIRHRVS